MVDYSRQGHDFKILLQDEKVLRVALETENNRLKEKINNLDGTCGCMEKFKALYQLILRLKNIRHTIDTTDNQISLSLPMAQGPSCDGDDEGVVEEENDGKCIRNRDVPFPFFIFECIYRIRHF